MCIRRPGSEGRSDRLDAEYCLLQYAGPGLPVVNIGVLLLDPRSDRLYSRLRSDWLGVAEPGEAEVLALLEDDLRSKADQVGASELLASFEDSFSNALRVTDRQPLQVSGFEEALVELFQRHVQSK
jgi:hypothetical protein